MRKKFKDKGNFLKSVDLNNDTDQKSEPSECQTQTEMDYDEMLGRLSGAHPLILWSIMM